MESRREVQALASKDQHTRLAPAVPEGTPSTAPAPVAASSGGVWSRPRKPPAAPAGDGEEKRLGRPPMVDDPREEILRQAAKMFAQKGYGASSLSQVAATLNYSKGAIYNYFATKQEIYDAIIIRTLEGLNRAGAEAVAEGRSPRERLRLFMIGHARYLAENYDSFVTMLVGYSGMASTALKDDALRLRDAHEGLLRAIIAEGVADGSFRAMDVAMTGRAVLSLLSWMARWYRPGGAMGAEQVADFYCDLIASGLLPR